MLGLLQFAATGQFDDGSVSDVSNFATWISSNANVASVSATGIASTGAKGQHDDQRHPLGSHWLDGIDSHAGDTG